jgi:hypothetical protein
MPRSVAAFVLQTNPPHSSAQGVNRSEPGRRSYKVVYVADGTAFVPEGRVVRLSQ